MFPAKRYWWLRKYIGFPEKKALIEAFVFPNFNYGPLVWHFFTSITSGNKTESIQKRTLRLLCNDYTNNDDSLLAKANKPSMELKRYRTLALEMFQILNVWNPTYMQDPFYLRSSSARRPNNIAVVRANTNTYGTKSLRSLGTQIWISLPEHIKTETSFEHFQVWLILALVKNASAACEHTIILNSTN